MFHRGKTARGVNVFSSRERLAEMFQTVVVTQNQVICRLPEYFDQPNSFVPERWLRDDDVENTGQTSTKQKSVHPYLVLPFGHGPRSCIARRFAEQNMQVVLLRVRVCTLLLYLVYRNRDNNINDNVRRAYFSDVSRATVHLVWRKGIARLDLVADQ